METARPPATTEVAASPLRRLGEAVADAEHSLDIAGADLAADVLDVCVDRSLVRLECHASHGVQELGAREHPARLAGHRGNDLELALGQVDTAAGKPRLHPWDVQLHVGADAAH